jgi:dienelactone hydrolase
MNKTLASSLVLGLIGLVGCPDIKTDTGEGDVGPTVQFDPAASIIPFPNNLALDPMTGRVSLPKQCGEGLAQMVIRTELINKLDGFGTYESALQVTFSEALDAKTLDGHVLLYQRAKGMTANEPAIAMPIPVTLLPPMLTPQFSADCSTSKMVTTLIFIAQGALEQHSTYTVALTKGIKTASGTDFGASFFWSLVGQASAPVTFDDQGNVTANHTPLDPRDEAQLAQLEGVALLWKAHKPALDFLAGTGHARGDLLVAWEFNTQSNDALDPTVAGSPAAAAYASTTPLQGITTQVPPGVTPTQVLQSKGIPCDTGSGGLPCDSVGDILAGGLISKSYQQVFGGVPGPWNDSVHPTVVNPNNIVQVLAAVPTGAAPAGGWPTVVFGHGLGSSKTTMFAIAPQLAKAGFATVAIDFVAHDSRAVRTSTDPAKGCADVASVPPDPTKAPQCFAPFLSSDLAGTRDNIRQTVLDLEGLVAAIKACGTASCGVLKVDAMHLAYMGISLGGIIGSTTVANVPDFKGAVLNVPGVGLIDVLENTPNLDIRCSLVDALISVGVVTGAPYNRANQTGLCTTDAWKTQAGYQQFAVIGRWALDPADGANFTRKLASRKILIQEVVNDQVVPNIATDREGALVGLMPQVADVAMSATPAPSAAIAPANPNANKWVRYPAVPAASPFPGNTFQHASLLQPAGTDATHAAGTPDGQLGTARVQTDAITFLVLNQ